MPHANATLIRNFYAALGQADAAAMGACYADNARFSDPVFRDLDAAGVRAMWAMLCARATDLEVSVSGVEADERSGSARWIATYTFSRTGRRVRNVIDARFEIRAGKIVRHTDRFDLWRWAGMALGVKGKLLGWLPAVQNAIRREAAQGLAAYRRQHSAS